MNDTELDKLIAGYRDQYLFAQDKVDRMVRLAKLNFLMFGGVARNVFQGNSIFGVSSIDRYIRRAALIATNPPFGAECRVSELAAAPDFQQRYPMLSMWYASRSGTPTTLSSELVMLDRSFGLLRPGGRLLIVLPDSVISAQGVYARARHWLAQHATLKAVVELPAVTFAQAGTRTKTCVLFLQKPYHASTRHTRIFMAVCDDVGYSVMERGGVPVKQAAGRNELLDISRVYEGGSCSGDTYEVASAHPACVYLAEPGLLNGRWTPNFYQPMRLNALSLLASVDVTKFRVRSLQQVATLCSSKRRMRHNAEPKGGCISVLHVQDDGTIDTRQVLNYAPKTPGLTCYPGDVLFSKINPRIPRICVVPELGVPLTCSSEFEILRPVAGLDPYVLATLLLVPPVQQQIQCLTSGTSSSHNRIKDAELAQVQLPVPIEGTEIWATFDRLGRDLRRAFAEKHAATQSLDSARLHLLSLLLPDDGTQTRLANITAPSDVLDVHGKNMHLVEPTTRPLFSMED